MFGVALSVAALSALSLAEPSAPRAVVVAWDARRSPGILSQIKAGADVDVLRKTAKETDYRIEFVGGDAYCFQSGMMGERELLAQAALYRQITRSIESQRGVIDHKRLGEVNWATLRSKLASILAREGVTEKDLDSSRLVVLADHLFHMRGAGREIDFYPAASSQPQAGDLAEGAVFRQGAWGPLTAKASLAQTTMSVVASDLGPKEQAVLFRQAAQMLENHIEQLVDDVALAQSEAYEALSSKSPEDKDIDSQASNLGALGPESQAYVANSFGNAYRWLGFTDLNQARAFVSLASFDKIQPVLVMIVTIPTKGGGIRTVTVVLPSIERV
ncbi:MAG: hypothetical protein JSS65_14570 [Armatimonadetes bacterium]|nr:hypothetical protein [Armatimonadota bacterium]